MSLIKQFYNSDKYFFKYSIKIKKLKNHYLLKEHEKLEIEVRE